LVGCDLSQRLYTEHSVQEAASTPAGKAVTGHRTPNKNSNQIRSGCDGSSFFKPLLASEVNR